MSRSGANKFSHGTSRSTGVFIAFHEHLSYKILEEYMNLEKTNKTKSHVRKLINSDGSEETNRKNILANIKSFIQNCMQDVA